MSAAVTNVAASVRQRLANLAKERGEDFEQLLVRYALERLLYRLSVSKHAENFVLKGALLFRLWFNLEQRPTRDIDLLGFGVADTGSVKKVFRELIVRTPPALSALKFIRQPVDIAWSKCIKGVSHANS